MDDNEWVNAMEMELFESGAMFLQGVDEDGDFVVGFDMQKLQEVCPELHEMWNNEVIETMASLAEKGLVNLDLTHEDGMVMELTELGQEVLDIIKDQS